MAETSFETNGTRKKRILRLSYIFIGVMLVLTFFSNTINNFSLPRVSAEQPVGGALIKEVTGSGIVQAKETVKVYSEQGRLVDEVRAKAGDRVKKGQVLVVLDREDIEQQLEEETLRYDQMKLSLEKLTDADAQPNIASAEKDLETAKQNLEDKKAMYDSGVIGGEELKQAENALFQAEKALDDENRKQRDNDRDIKIQQDSLKLEELNINKLQKELNEDSTLASPVDGVVSELNVSQGSLVNGGSPVFSVADVSKGFEVVLSVDQEKAQYLAVGDAADVAVKSLGSDALKGTIREIADNAQDRGEIKDLSIDMPSDGIAGGERCDVYINKKTRAYAALVPNTAVGTDTTGKFVWVLKEKKGALGSEFYVQKAIVTVDDSDSSKTAVINGISPEDQVIVSYSKSLSDGGRVLPEN